MTKITIRPDTDLIVVTEESHLEVEVGMDRQNYRGRLQYSDNYRNDIRKGNFREMQNYRGQNYRSGCRDNYRVNYRDNYRDNYRNDNLEEVGVGLGKDGSQVTLEGMIEAVADQDRG